MLASIILSYYILHQVPTAISAILNYSVEIAGDNRTDALRVPIELLDADGVVIANNTDFQSRLVVQKSNLWEPCGMNHTHT